MADDEPRLRAVLDDLLENLGSAASRRAYESDWAAFRAWLATEGLPALAVGPRDVKRYVQWLSTEQKARATRARALSAVREVYRALVGADVIAVNPAREVKNAKRGKGAGDVTWLDAGELAAILSWRGDTWRARRDRMCIQLLAGTGRRRSEVAALCVANFTADRVTGEVKGGEEKSAPLPTWLRHELTKWLTTAGIASGPVLPRSDNDRRAISGDMVYNVVRRVAVASGIEKKIAPHGIRRTLATEARKRGVPLADIQAQLGHKRSATTELYLKGSQKVEVAPGEWMGALINSPPKETP